MTEHNTPPDFIIIGAMKSGTTTLYSYLSLHPGIFMTTPKEPGFFSRNDVFAKGTDWYLALFKTAAPDQIRGEASTCYSRWPAYPEAAKRIHEFNSKTKFIYVLRHPVDRAYSHYGHLVYSDKKPYRSFEEALKAEDEIISASKYMLQINKFLEYFPKEQILLVDFDEMIHKTAETLATIQKFLGCDVQNLAQQNKIAANQASEKSVQKNFVNYLRKIRNLPGIKTLIDLTLNQQARKTIRQQLVAGLLNSFVGQMMMKTKKQQLSPIQPETRSKLLNELKADTRELEIYWERNLSNWYK